MRLAAFSGDPVGGHPLDREPVDRRPHRAGGSLQEGRAERRRNRLLQEVDRPAPAGSCALRRLVQLRHVARPGAGSCRSHHRIAGDASIEARFSSGAAEPRSGARKDRPERARSLAVARYFNRACGRHRGHGHASRHGAGEHRPRPRSERCRYRCGGRAPAEARPSPRRQGHPALGRVAHAPVQMAGSRGLGALRAAGSAPRYLAPVARQPGRRPFLPARDSAHRYSRTARRSAASSRRRHDARQGQGTAAGQAADRLCLVGFPRTCGRLLHGRNPGTARPRPLRGLGLLLRDRAGRSDEGADPGRGR